MKNKYSKLILSLSFLLLIGLGGCLKDKDFDNNVNQAVESHGGGVQNVVSVGLTSTTTDNHLQLAFTSSSSDTVFNAIPVTLGGQVAKEDVKVTLRLNPAVIGNYNANNGTSHEEAPLALYSIVNPGDSTSGYVVTIPKGSSTGFLKIKLKSANFLGFDYAIGVQISSVQSGYLIATNLATGVLAIGVKNKWDGVYSYKGYTLRAGDPARTGNFAGKEVSLVTAGIASVSFETLPVWADGSGIGIDKPKLDIDESTNPNPITISGATGGGTVPQNNPSYTSTYDPTTKTFYISFTWAAGPTARLSTDTLTYLRPR